MTRRGEIISPRPAPFWHGGSHIRILVRIVQIIDNLCQIFLCLIFSCYIREMNAFGGLDIDFRITLSHAKGHGIFSADLLHQLFRHIVAEDNKDHEWQ